MARRHCLDLGDGMLLEAQRGDAGWSFTALRRGSARWFRDPVALRKWLGLPLKTTSRERFDAWLAELQAPAAAGPEADPTADTRMVT